MIVTRFAPSPTGGLHLGHAYSAMQSYDFAKRHGGKFLLRIEDIDPTRCKPEFTAAIFEDLAWLGLEWEEPVWLQSDRLHVYRQALNRLSNLGVLYPCFCTRKEIQEEVARSGEATHGSDGVIYPGTCRYLRDSAQRLASGEEYALRLDSAEALRSVGPLAWCDGQQVDISAFGDVVLARKDIGTSYHLSVTVDDAAQEVTHVIRGRDLYDATHAT